MNKEGIKKYGWEPVDNKANGIKFMDEHQELHIVSVTTHISVMTNEPIGFLIFYYKIIPNE